MINKKEIIFNKLKDYLDNKKSVWVKHENEDKNIQDVLREDNEYFILIYDTLNMESNTNLIELSDNPDNYTTINFQAPVFNQDDFKEKGILTKIKENLL